MTDDDDIDFQKAMHGVRPLNQDKHEPHQKKPRHKKKSREDLVMQSRPVAYEYDFGLVNQDDWVGPEDKIVFKRSGVQSKVIDKLRRGQYPCEARIDLHHFTAGEAMAMVDQFIDQCIIEDIRCVLMIHGKGYMSRSDKPILKNILIEHLRQNPYVLAYHFARPRDGGTGALYVLLKASHKVL
jgi:DNA-nicking Smr family endonuclease